MFDKLFVYGGFNPVTKGHLYLFKKGLEVSNSLDIYAGRKRKVDRLPYGVRIRALDTVIKNNNLENKAKVVIPARLFEVDSKNYSGILYGSDILNIFVKNGFSTAEGKFVNSFEKIVCVERSESPLSNEILNLIKSDKCLFLEGESPLVSSTSIRRAYGNCEDIEEMLPPGVWNVIKDHIGVFNNGVFSC